jgi:hypothetical protein
MEDVGTFYCHLVYFTAIWYILWPFGKFYGRLVYFSRCGLVVCCTNKNLATLFISRTTRLFAASQRWRRHLKLRLLQVRPILNFAPKGKLWPQRWSCPPGVNFVSWGWSHPLEVKFSICPSILLNIRVNEGVNTPLGVTVTSGQQGDQIGRILASCLLSAAFWKIQM